MKTLWILLIIIATLPPLAVQAESLGDLTERFRLENEIQHNRDELQQYRQQLEMQRSQDELRRAFDQQRRADDRLWQQEQIDDLQMELDEQRDRQMWERLNR